MSDTAPPVLETARLRLRRLDADDAAFIFELVNDPDWLRHIGDKNVRSLDDARGYIENGPEAMFRRHGFALLRVETKSDGTPIGICGLLRRDTLEDPDIGFAFLPAFRGRGYAREAAAATLADAKQRLRIDRVLAIVSPDNADSAKLLETVGFRFERMQKGTVGDKDLRVFAMAL